MRKATQQNPARQARTDNAQRRTETVAAAQAKQDAMFARRASRDLMLKRSTFKDRLALDATNDLEAQGLIDETVTLEEAAQVLCGETKNPMKNLKARIAKGTVQTVEVNGETRVIL